SPTRRSSDLTRSAAIRDSDINPNTNASTKAPAALMRVSRTVLTSPDHNTGAASRRDSRNSSITSLRPGTQPGPGTPQGRPGARAAGRDPSLGRLAERLGGQVRRRDGRLVEPERADQLEELLLVLVQLLQLGVECVEQIGVLLAEHRTAGAGLLLAVDHGDERLGHL